MNSHLKPVFDVLLPGLEKARIDYWVFGGVSIAAYAGEFIRRNGDVDIFVRDGDFVKAKSVLEYLCEQNDFNIKYYPLAKYGRPKVDIKIAKRKRLSMVPVYQKDDSIEFRYPKGNEEYSKRILQKVERVLSGFRFFSPQNRFIKEIFIKHIKARPDKKDRAKFQIDAKAILSPEEFVQLGFKSLTLRVKRGAT